MGQTIFVKNTGKSTSQGIYCCWCLFSKSYIVYTHHNPSKMYSPNPQFPHSSSSLQHQELQSVGGTWWTPASLLCLVKQSIRSVARFPTWPLFLPSSWLSKLQIYGPQPYYHLNPTAIWKEFKIIWDEWNERTCFTDGHSTFQVNCFLNEFLDSVWSWMPWSFWVIISSLRHCDFVRCLKEKVINILETVLDKLGNQMAAENLWNAD